jgi:hypothetical protein
VDTHLVERFGQRSTCTRMENCFSHLAKGTTLPPPRARVTATATQFLTKVLKFRVHCRGFSHFFPTRKIIDELEDHVERELSRLREKNINTAGPGRPPEREFCGLRRNLAACRRRGLNRLQIKSHAKNKPKIYSERASRNDPTDESHHSTRWSHNPVNARSISALISPPIRNASPIKYSQTSKIITASREPYVAGYVLRKCR